MSDLLTKIGNLLRKAETTDNEHEADAFLQAAQRLATQSSIDLEVARARQQSTERRPVPVQRQIVLGERGKKGLSTYVELFSAIAHTNDVRINIAHNSTYVIAFGMDTDVEVVEALYAGIVTQMVEASDKYIRSGEYKSELIWSERKWEMVPVHGSTARISFQSAFAQRIGQRLRDARRAAVEQAVSAQAERPIAATSAELVLKRKEDQVDEFYRQASRARGSYKGWNRTNHSSAGRAAGRAAGDRARISTSCAIGGARTALA